MTNELDQLREATERRHSPSVATDPSSGKTSNIGLRILIIAHVDIARSRIDRQYLDRYETLAQRPGVTLFGPGVEGYRPGITIREAVELSCGGVWPDVIYHGENLVDLGVPLVTGLEDAEALKAIEIHHAWAGQDSLATFMSQKRIDLGLVTASQYIPVYQERCPRAEFFWTPNAVDTHLYRNYRLPKEYDIILYGYLDSGMYPFRARLASLLAGQSGLRFRHIPHPGYFLSHREQAITDADLSREINRSWIGIATCSIYNCLFAKYLEIPASYALVAGNMPDEGRPFFENNFIELRKEQSDEEILATLHTYLADKNRLAALTDMAHQRIVRECSIDAYADRLFSLFGRKVEERRAAARLRIGGLPAAQTQPR